MDSRLGALPDDIEALKAALVAEHGERIAEAARATHAEAELAVARECPMVARQFEVDRLRGTEIRGYVPAPPRFNSFRPGQTVLIKRGAFHNKLAVYSHEMENLDCVTLQFLGASAQVELPLGSIVMA